MRRSRYRGGPHFLLGALLFALTVLAGCTGMVQDELDTTHAKLDETQAKLESLQKLVTDANSELARLDRIVSALDDNHTVVPGSFEATEGGFKLSFRDGETIEIKAGNNGTDGRVFPIGVARDEEDGLYYWTIDYLDGGGVIWLLDADGNKVRAGATDGQNGITPEIRVEEDGWYLCVGEEVTKLAGLGDLDGIGVLRDAYEEADRICLVQWGGEVLELPKYIPVRISFSGPVRDTVLIAGGEILPIPFEVLVEGNSGEEPVVVTSGTDGTYFSEIVKGVDSGVDTVKVTAPAEFTEGYILLTAYCGGSSALKMIAFQPRVVEPSEKDILLRFGSGTYFRDIPYKTNFPYVILKPEDASWLEVSSNPETGVLSFTSQPNDTDDIRACEIAIAPADNPKQVITTFRILQASEAFKFYFEEGGTLAYDPEDNTLQAPAEGGDGVLWITFPESVDLSISVPETAGWLHAVLTAEDGFRKLQVHVDPVEDTAERRESIYLQLKAGGFPIGEIKVVQAGMTSGASEE